MISAIQKPICLALLSSMAPTSCISKCIDQEVPGEVAPSTESGVFREFQYNNEYANLVERAEGGDRESILRLANYYCNFPTTDLRNLEYWSEKAAIFEGSIAYACLISSLASHGECDRAWDIFDRNYRNYRRRLDPIVYRSNGRTETIDEICPRRRQ